VTVALWFDPDGTFWCSVGDVQFQLNPWIGVQLQAWDELGCDWRREDVRDYQPNDLYQWLQANGEAYVRSKG